MGAGDRVCRVLPGVLAGAWLGSALSGLYNEFFRFPVLVYHPCDRLRVFVVRDGRAARRVVRLGQRSGLEAQVLDGLAEGDPVVLYPPDTLSDGDRVREREI